MSTSSDEKVPQPNRAEVRAAAAHQAWRMHMAREASNFPMETEYALEEQLIEPPTEGSLDDDLPPGWRWDTSGTVAMTPEEAAQFDRQFSLTLRALANVFDPQGVHHE